MPLVTVAVGDADVLEIPLGRGLVEVHQPPGLAEGERTEEQAVEDAEDGGVARDSEGQHEDHGGAERGLVADHAKHHSQVLPDAFHDVSSSSYRSDSQRLRGDGLPGSPQFLGETVAALQFFEGQELCSVSWYPLGEQFAIAIVQVARQFFDDLGFARAFEVQSAEAFADGVLPLRHTQAP